MLWLMKGAQAQWPQALIYTWLAPFSTAGIQGGFFLPARPTVPSVNPRISFPIEACFLAQIWQKSGVFVRRSRHSPRRTDSRNNH